MTDNEIIIECIERVKEVAFEQFKSKCSIADIATFCGELDKIAKEMLGVD